MVAEYTYNLNNQLTGYKEGEKVITYSYNADGLRDVKSIGRIYGIDSVYAIDTEYVWSNGNLVAEKEKTGTTAIYNYGIDGIATRKKAGNTEYYVKNIHGDVTALTDSTGAITKNYQFDAFGNELAENDNDTNPFRYCGEYYDAETGLIYLRNRYYDTATGRFITEDPVKDGLNWYVYCANNPVMYVDPSGLLISKWDEENCSPKDLETLRENDRIWATGNDAQKKVATLSSRNIRKKYLSQNEKLLENGCVETYYMDSIYAKSKSNNITVDTSISYKRIYGKATYLQLLKVEVYISSNDGALLKSAKFHIGQNAIGSERKEYSGNIQNRKLESTLNWEPIYDDGGAGHTMIGVVVEINARNSRTMNIANLTVCNQIYSKYIIDNGIIRDENFDYIDVIREGLQRGER